MIAGSNGYINNSIAIPAGYSGEQVFGSAAINAPNDCNGNNTYMGVKIVRTAMVDTHGTILDTR